MNLIGIKKVKFIHVIFLTMSATLIFVIIQLFMLKNLNRNQRIAFAFDDDSINNIKINGNISIYTNNTPIGVHYKHAHLYKADKDGYFTCLESKERILFTHFNDDYCDCKDGTDEPATNACPTSKFYCKTQYDTNEHHFISSSKVNDGICDCCDASDEYNNNKLICESTCDSKLKEIQKKREIKRISSKAKEEYVLAGRGKNEQLYGPNGVLFKLSQKCYNLKSGEFDYEVCPYQKVTQKSRNHMNLGVRSHLSQEKSKLILLMDSGDTLLCTKARSSKIIFDCALEDKLIRVEEPEQCFYVFYMTTIAAC